MRPVPEGNKSFILTLVLSFFLGFFGADRFYLGKNRSALLKLFTFGGFGYWVLIDLLMTLFGGQRDVWGLRLAGYDRHKKTVWIVIGAIFGSTVFVSIAAATILAAFGSGGPTVFGWVLLVLLAAAGAAGGTIWILRRRAARRTTALPTRAADPLPPRIRVLIQEIMETRQQYQRRAKSGDRMARAVIVQVDSLVANVTELFRRLRVGSEPGLAQVEYEAKLGKLAAALDEDYLLDVLAKPQLWDHPEQRISEMQEAIEALNVQLLENIRQVNAHRALVFQVGLGDLSRPRNAMDDWQRDFDEASAGRPR